MNGPYPKGTYRRYNNTFRHLYPNKVYRVQRSFIDFDNHMHAEGEEWAFRGACYIAQEDGISLFIEIDNCEWNIPLKWSEGYQLDVIENISSYVTSVNNSEKKQTRSLHQPVEKGSQSSLQAALGKHS